MESSDDVSIQLFWYLGMFPRKHQQLALKILLNMHLAMLVCGQFYKIVVFKQLASGFIKNGVD